MLLATLAGPRCMMFWDQVVDARPRGAAPRTPAPRLESLQSARVVFLHNHKPNAIQLFEIIKDLLVEEQGVASCEYVSTEALASPAERRVIDRVVDAADVVVVGTGDSGSPSLLTVHDALAIEALGTPAVPVCTRAFLEGAAMIAAIRGAPWLRFAVIDHPLTTADENGLARRARQALPQLCSIATTVHRASGR